MKKCLVCKFCSWIVGLSTLWLAGMALGGWPLPAGGWINILYAVLGLIALTFLYYQLVPCSRCMARNGQTKKQNKLEKKFETQSQTKTPMQPRQEPYWEAEGETKE